MVDVKGKELAIGDHVVFIYGANSRPVLRTGRVTNIASSNMECSVDGKPHIYTRRVMKIPKEV